MQTFIDFGQEISEDFNSFRKLSTPVKFHIHPHYEIMFFLHPISVETIIAGNRYLTDYPCAILLSPFTPHMSNIIEMSGVYNRYVIYFGNPVVDNMRRRNKDNGRCSVIDVDSMLSGGAARIFDIRECFDQVEQLISIYMGLTEQYDKQSILELILRIIFRHCSDGHPALTAMKTNTYIVNVIEYITDHLDSKCVTGEIAAVFFVSEDKLRKDFKHFIGVNIGEFIGRLKLNHAMALLENGDMTVADISKQCGFVDESYFYRFFRSETGITPLKYRKQYMRQ